MASASGDTPVEHRISVTRSARYYSLGANDAAETWVVLHGYSQLAGAFVRTFAPVAGPGRRVIAPEALNRYYTNHKARKVGATWMTSEDRLAEIADYVAYLDQVAGAARAAAGRGRRLEVHGFSQGCATASRWAVLGRARPDRLVLWGGGVPPDLDLMGHRETLNRMALTIVVGDRDQFVPETAVQAERGRLEQAGVRFTLTRFRGGHLIPWPVLATLAGADPRATP